MGPSSVEGEGPLYKSGAHLAVRVDEWGAEEKENEEQEGRASGTAAVESEKALESEKGDLYTYLAQATEEMDFEEAANWCSEEAGHQEKE